MEEVRSVSEGYLWCAAQYLRTISYAKLQQSMGGWGQWIPEWWRKREEEAVGTLAALRKAIKEQSCGR